MAAERQLDAAVTLMPHVWSPLVNGVFRSAGVRYATVIHDANRHPGDHRGFADRWTRRDARAADVIFTLSRTVGERLATGQPRLRDQIVRLFHPELDFGRKADIRRRDAARPLKLLFLGRIMRYKGLGLLVESLELLRERGIEVELGVYGEGVIGSYHARLASMGAEIVNRWLTEAEVADALAKHDAVVLSHIEASQSGVAAAAFGAGVPVIATPVGGLTEQVVDGETGVLATAVDPAAFADAVARLSGDPGLYDRIADNLAAGASNRSMRRFIELMIAALDKAPHAPAR